ncbi:GTP pyrophosphokinase family protein [Gilliamella sp. BG7]|uniref:GTP pyrophosphokinase n=1 Tax=unclassified Gilliamella TaxID=2685620 RepID=UPI003987F28A
MDQNEFRKKYESEMPMFKAWGDFVLSRIVNKLPENFVENAIKIPLYRENHPRLKDINSLLAKAFIRKKRNYEEITDKIGIRFVVLLESHVMALKNIIENSPDWRYSKDRELDDWRKNDPRIFDYKSLHYIVYSKKIFNYDGISINKDTPCEIQVRTLLQHAYAEMSHDKIYKSITKDIPAEVKRLMAKSMALMETTDELLSKADETIDIFISELSGSWVDVTIKIANKLTNDNYDAKDNSNNIYLLEELKELLDKYSIDEYIKFLTAKPYIFNKIEENQMLMVEFKQLLTPLIYFLVEKESYNIKDYDVYSHNAMEQIFSDLGISYS